MSGQPAPLLPPARSLSPRRNFAPAAPPLSVPAPRPPPPAPTHQRTSCQRFSPGVPRPAMPRPTEAAPAAAGRCRGRARRRGVRRGDRRAGRGGAGARRRGPEPGLRGAIGVFISPLPAPHTPPRAPPAGSLDPTGAGSPRASAAAGTTTFPSPSLLPGPLAGGAEELASGALGEEAGSPGSTVVGA